MVRLARLRNEANENQVIDGWRIYYNFIRPHMAPNGKTPAEACGIKIEGKNKWLTLIQNSARS